MGRPAQLTRQELEQLRERSVPVVCPLDTGSINGTGAVELTLRDDEVVLLEMQPQR